MRNLRPEVLLSIVVLLAFPLSCGMPPVPADVPSAGRSLTPAPSDPLPTAARAAYAATADILGTKWASSASRIPVQIDYQRGAPP